MKFDMRFASKRAKNLKKLTTNHTKTKEMTTEAFCSASWFFLFV